MGVTSRLPTAAAAAVGGCYHPIHSSILNVVDLEGKSFMYRGDRKVNTTRTSSSLEFPLDLLPGFLRVVWLLCKELLINAVIAFTLLQRSTAPGKGVRVLVQQCESGVLQVGLSCLQPTPTTSSLLLVPNIAHLAMYQSGAQQ